MALVTRSQTRGVITLQTSSATFIAEILDMSWTGLKRDFIDVSNMSATAATVGALTFGNKVFIPSIYIDVGELTVEMSFNPDAVLPITSAGAETITIKLGGDTLTQSSYAFSGFFYDFSFKLPFDGKQMTCSAKIKFTSSLTITAGT